MGIETRLNFIASYPKSGNTWVRILLVSAMNSAVTEYSDIGIYFYQTVSPMAVKDLNHYQAAQLRGAAMLSIAGAAAGERTMVKTHHGCYDVEGVRLFAKAFARKAIYIIRDPRDVAASMVHHFGMSQDDVVKFMSDEGAGINEEDKPKMPSILSTWSRHVISWTGDEIVPTHVIRYEDLYSDPVDTLAGMLDFLEWKPAAKLERVVELCAFDRLQKQEKEHGFIEKSRHAELFFRRGIVGSYKDELDPETVTRLEADHGEVMQAQGYVRDTHRHGIVTVTEEGA